MNEGFAVELVRQMLVLVCQLAGPVLLGGLVLGVVAGAIQAATQIQEQTLTFLPKLCLAIATVGLGGPWAVERMVAFAVAMIQQVGSLGPAGIGA